MELHPAADSEVGVILYTLCEARKRPYSADFLDPWPENPSTGFPWTSIIWHKVEDLEIPQLEGLYLFWDGSAWGESGPPRTLKQGVKDFRRIAADITKPNYEHLIDILKCRDRYRAGARPEPERFLILVGQSPYSRLLILDGNHRAVAALWWSYEINNPNHLPRTAWLGLSDQMGRYWGYSRIP